MKTIAIVLLLAVAAFAAPVPEEVGLPTSCEDVLAVKVCNSLRRVATKIGLSFKEVEDRIKDSISEGKELADEILDSVRTFLEEKIAPKTCEDFLSADRCEKVRKLAGFLGVASEKVDEAVRAAVIKGALKITEIYKEVVSYLKGLLAGKRSIEMTLTDFDMELLDEIELDDEYEFQKRNIVIDILKKKIKFLSSIFGDIVKENLEKVISQVLADKGPEIEAVIGKGPYAVIKLAWDLYQQAKAMG